MVNYIEKIQGKADIAHGYRLGITFSTRNKKYMYDTGTGKVFECEEIEYRVLKELFENSRIMDSIEGVSKSQLQEAYKNIWNLVEQEHILQVRPDLKFVRGSDETMRDLLHYDLQQIVLELTEQCNMRCRYCIYNEHNDHYRNFSPKSMSWDIAKRAVEYARDNSGDRIAVSFYGGEPLVQFDLMKKVIES